ncbi:Nucleotide-binding oligomerization domain-containing protein 2 [Hondaea fermentalgiana]|uniref:Nucleotide-binding oligomerization domain-containing protein 2 n=1 Tax=Hondaea fermentalgiana TaxID=2315210 RepID=A0A2R5GBZ3_9STRA|nr:Nucleotide-binding oligomerization domain-containing protein 2 [Hondaea fermentalgiana]|eukprot:GBG28510.1 Nucleotide-binding oligomerization domain-containing protein 2 [Hondaea fermentalgiana]
MSAKTKAGATDEDVVLVLGEAPGEDATPPQDAREVWELVDQLVEEEHVPLEARMTEDRQGVAEICHSSCGAALCRLEEIEGLLAVNALRAAAEDPDAMRSLNQRELGDIGACIVAQHLRLPHVKAPSSLYLLGLAKAGIGARGAEALADALASSSSYAKTIRIVELYSNEPGLHWATFCARLIRQNRLQSIDVGSNGLDDEGAMLIAEALLDVSEASHLAELHLDYNRITGQGLRVLTQAAERALALHTVWLHGNPISTSENGLERLLRPRQQARLGIPSRGAMVQDLQARVEELLRPSRIFLRDLDQGSAWPPDSLADEVASICVEAYTTVCPGHAQTTSLSLDPCTPSCKGGAGTACAVYREGERHSCTDKVQRWAAQGLQGKLLKKSIGKVPLGRVVIGQKWSERCAQVIPGAISCSQKPLNALQGTKTFQQRGDSDASFAWWHGLGATSKAISFDGKTGLTIDAQAVALAPRCLALEHEAALQFTHSPTPTGSAKEQKI